MRAFTWTAALIALLAAGGCANGPQTITPVDAAAIRLAVDGVSKAFNAALAARDTAALDSLFADDASELPPDLPRVDGRAAIHRLWADAMAAPGFQLTSIHRQTTIAAAGDLAVATGVYEYRALDPLGRPVREIGKFVTVFKPVRGAWKITTDIWNRDEPSPAPAR